MIVVGVTGSLATGKTEVTELLKSMGAKIFDADESARNALKPGKPAYKAVIKIFGKQFIGKNKQIDRKKLALHVFTHPADLKKLNILIHPGVIFECLELIEKNRSKKGLLVMDVPLLFESKMEELADFTVLVSASKDNITKRAAKKGIPEELAKKIVASQWPLDKKKKLADFVIENNGSLADLKKQTEGVVQRIKAASEDRASAFFKAESEFALKA